MGRLTRAPTPSQVGSTFSRLQRHAFGHLDTIHRLCPLCGNDNAASAPSRYSLGQWIVKTCATCAFVYIEVAPNYDALLENMAWEKSWVVEQTWRSTSRRMQHAASKTTRWRLHMIRRKRMPALLKRYAAAGNVIDLGCGDGGTLDGLADRFVPHGIEIGANAAQLANERFKRCGGMVINAPCLEGLRRFPDRYVTAATLRSYLEHEINPRQVLTELHRTLADRGIAIVKVPNFGSLNRRLTGRRWCGFRHPDHVNYFTPATLRRMAVACGFSVRFGATFRLPTSDSMYAILTKA